MSKVALEAPLRVLAIGDSDTRLKWAAHLAAAIPNTVTECRSLDTRQALSERQVAELGLPNHDVVPLRSLRDGSAIAGYGIVVACMTGGELYRLRRVAERRASAGGRPLLVTGYAGVVYEKHLEGILWRIGYDVICANAESDAAMFARWLGELDVSSESLRVAGLAIARNAEPVETAWPPRRIVFAVQPDVPERRVDRVALLGELVSYAVRHRDREVVVKLRSLPDEVTTHPEAHNYAALLAEEFPHAPPNISCVYAPMSEVLDRTDLLITVSSTASMEAWARGIPVGILGDVGLGESLWNHHFVASGAVTSIRALADDWIPTVKSEWLADSGVDVEATSRLGEEIRRLSYLVNAGDIPWSPPYYTDYNAAPLLARLASQSTIVTPSNGRRLAVRVIRGLARRIGRRVARWLEL